MLQTKEATRALRRFYRTLRRTRQLKWQAYVTVKGAIRIRLSKDSLGYCPITASYSMQHPGKFTTVNDAYGIMADVGLNVRLRPGGPWNVGYFIIQAADTASERIRLTHVPGHWVTYATLRIRRVMFRNLGLDPKLL